MLVLVAPGQGAQTPGFLNPWLDLPGVADRLTWWSAAAGLDLVHYGTKADADEIRDTAVAQPLLVAAGLLAAFSLFEQPGEAHTASPFVSPLTPSSFASPPAPALRGGTPAACSRASLTGAVGAVAGHSVGEITAAAAAGVISPETAMVLVRKRGEAMAQAAAVTETGMSAVLGGDTQSVVAKLESLGLTPANMNGAGQIVAAGTREQLDALATDKPEKSRVISLKVAGAFHTHHMAPAVATLEALVRGMTVHDPGTSYVSNADGKVVGSGAEIVQRLVNQVANPVRWDLCMETFKDFGITALIEVAPAGTLAGLAKRALPGVQTVALKTPDDIAAARAIVAEHAAV